MMLSIFLSFSALSFFWGQNPSTLSSHVPPPPRRGAPARCSLCSFPPRRLGFRRCVWEKKRKRNQGEKVTEAERGTHPLETRKKKAGSRGSSFFSAAPSLSPGTIISFHPSCRAFLKHQRSILYSMGEKKERETGKKPLSSFFSPTFEKNQKKISSADSHALLRLLLLQGPLPHHQKRPHRRPDGEGGRHERNQLVRVEHKPRRDR